MSTIKDKLYFVYNGVSCKDLGLMNINLDNGMFEESFGPSREIVETETKNGRPLFNRIKESPREFDLSIAFIEDFDEEKIDDVIEWIFQDYYKPLYFEGNPGKIYHCMAIGEPKIVHNGLKQGYFTITMRCSSPNVLSPNKQVEVNIPSTGGNITIQNDGHYEVYPEVSIKKTGNGHVTFTNGNGKIFEVRDLTNQEGIYLNIEKEIIESDLIGVYRYENTVGDFLNLALAKGKNTFKVTGECKVIFRYVEKYKF